MRANFRSQPASARGEQVIGDAAEVEQELRRRQRRTYNHSAQLRAHMHASKRCAGACLCATHAQRTLENRRRARWCLPEQLCSYIAALLMSLDLSSRRVNVKFEFRV